MASTDLGMLLGGGTIPEVYKSKRALNAMERRYANEERDPDGGAEVCE